MYVGLTALLAQPRKIHALDSLRSFTLISIFRCDQS